MPVSRLLVYPEPRPAAPLDSPAPFLGLGPIEPAASEEPVVEGPAQAPDLPAGFATAIGALGPVRAARWNRQLPVSAGVAAGPSGEGVRPNAEATSS